MLQSLKEFLVSLGENVSPEAKERQSQRNPAIDGEGETDKKYYLYVPQSIPSAQIDSIPTHIPRMYCFSDNKVE